MRPHSNIKILLALLLAAVLLIAGCNPAKRALKQQQAYRELTKDFVLNNPPVVDTDTVFIKGAIDTFFIKLPVPDPAAIKKVKDSLQAANEVKKLQQQWDCERQVNEAFDVGYQHARDELSQQKVTQPKTPDTVKIKIYPTDYINMLKEQLLTTQSRLQQQEDKTDWLWQFIVSAMFNVFFLIFIIKNTVKN